MNSVWQDIRQTLRMVRRSPGFTLAAVLTVALGVGATSAIFSVVDGVLLRSFPYSDPDRLVVVWERNLALGLPYMVVAPPNYADWRDQNSVFEGMGAFTFRRVILESETESDVVHGARVTAGALSLMGATPILGRSFAERDDREGSDPVVVLSYGSWQNRFGGDANVVGRTIRLDGRSHEVIGVMPKDFQFPPPVVLEGAIPTEQTELWIPFAMDMDGGSRGQHFMTVIARLRDDVSLATGQSEMNTIANRLQQDHPSTNADWGITLTPLSRQVLGDVSVQLLILLGAVSLVLLIASVNVTNLLLARGTTRLKEFALRASLGAQRGRLVRQLLTESLVLSLLGGLAGLALAYWGSNALVQLAPADIPRLSEVGLDVRVLSFTLIVSVLTGALVGLAPAFQGTGEDLSDRLREGGRGGAESRGRGRLRSTLVVTEIGMSLVLLVGAGLLIRSFVNLSGVDVGFQSVDRATLRVTLPASRYQEATQLARAYDEMERRLNSTPGIVAAGFINTLPLEADRGGTSFLKEGESEEPPGENRIVNFAVVTPTYLPAMGVNLVAGRYFTGEDDADAQAAVIVNDAFVRLHFPSEYPIGTRIYLQDRPLRIVGVVAGVRHTNLRDDPNPSVYVPYGQNPYSRSMTLVVHSEADGIFSVVRESIRRFDPTVPIYNMKTMGDVVGEALARMRFATTLMLGFALAALLLAAVGIYGVIAYSVSRRTHEIGVRVAVGAETSDVFRLVVSQGMKLVAIGIVIGTATSLVVSRFVASLLYGVGNTDLPTVGGVVIVLSVVAALACYVPARRAMQVDPVNALRDE
ncbi:MAG: ABC transporter permease [Gemmatimonadales bacterium]|jgi:putative ABC transport system permease protein